MRFVISLVAVAIAVSFAAACGTPLLPEPALTAKRDDALVERGRLLATTMGCLDCHSERDWTRYGGPFVEGKAFTGSPTFSSDIGMPPSFAFGAPNLTPAHLGSWSDGEIARAIALGQKKDGHGLFPIMPYPLWRESVALDDLAAVVAFLRSLPAAEGPPMPERKFPMPGFVVDGFPQAATLRATAPAPTDADFGQYVTIRSGCVDCHTPADARGRFTGPLFSGGRTFPMKNGTVRSPNLTPDEETGLGAWTKEAFVARFRVHTLEAVRKEPLAPEAMQSPMPWWAFAELTDTELAAIFDHLRAQPPTKNGVVRFEPL